MLMELSSSEDGHMEYSMKCATVEVMPILINVQYTFVYYPPPPQRLHFHKWVCYSINWVFTKAVSFSGLK